MQLLPCSSHNHQSIALASNAPNYRYVSAHRSTRTSISIQPHPLYLPKSQRTIKASPSILPNHKAVNNQCPGSVPGVSTNLHVSTVIYIHLHDVLGECMSHILFMIAFILNYTHEWISMNECMFQNGPLRIYYLQLGPQRINYFQLGP